MRILALKPVQTKAGKPMILVQTATTDVWLSPKQLTSKGCSLSLDVYVGGDIAIDYHKKGDVLLNGAICDTDDKLLKDFIISANPSVLAAALAIESKQKMEDMLDASALFARNKKPAVSTVTEVN
jgi:hypothetical protein